MQNIKTLKADKCGLAIETTTMYITYLIDRLSFRKIVKGGQKVNVENFGGAMYRVGVHCLGGSGGMLPRDFLGVPLSEVISGAFSDDNDVHVTV